ncbi:MAG: ATP-dependent Clp protease proteolytic subunit [Oscillospiraceae bacterium]|nr:ATP-dependent Clp protease proteolytic subunit [Candidatus Equicaccousia limihippi]
MDFSVKSAATLNDHGTKTTEENEQEEKESQQNEQINDFGSITCKNTDYPIHCLTVIGEIEGHYNLPQGSKTTKYEHVIPQLIAVEEDPEIRGLLVVLNTMGGDVEAGLAIAELISGMKKPTVSLVLGGGHSIGVPLAVSAKRSFIVPSATMTLHPVRTNGLVVGVPQTLRYFENMQHRIVNFVVDNSKITRKKLTELMMKTGEQATDMGSIIDGNVAVKVGLIDRVGRLSDAIDCLYQMIENSEKP